jgi:hypothetical protein
MGAVESDDDTDVALSQNKLAAGAATGATGATLATHSGVNLDALMHKRYCDVRSRGLRYLHDILTEAEASLDAPYRKMFLDLLNGRKQLAEGTMLHCLGEKCPKGPRIQHTISDLRNRNLKELLTHIVLYHSIKCPGTQLNEKVAKAALDLYKTPGEGFVLRENISGEELDRLIASSNDVRASAKRKQKLGPCHVGIASVATSGRTGARFNEPHAELEGVASARRDSVSANPPFNQAARSPVSPRRDPGQNAGRHSRASVSTPHNANHLLMAVGNEPDEEEEQQRILFLQRLDQILEAAEENTSDLQFLGGGASKQTFKITTNGEVGASAAVAMVYVFQHN